MIETKIPECIYQCKSCNKALCSKCAINQKHRTHDLEDYMDYRIALAERVKQARQEMRTLLEIEGSQAQLDRYKECNKKIDDYCDKIVKLITQARDKIKKRNDKTFAHYQDEVTEV